MQIISETGNGIKYGVTKHPILLTTGTQRPTDTEACLATHLESRLPSSGNKVLVFGVDTGLTSIVCCRSNISVLAFDEDETNFDNIKTNVRINGGGSQMIELKKRIPSTLTTTKVDKFSLVVIGETYTSKAHKWIEFDSILTEIAKGCKNGVKIIFLVSIALQEEAKSKLQKAKWGNTHTLHCHDNIVFVEATYLGDQ